ncbi:hypothetical protein ACJX0J_010270, partial [Zea mays]
LHVQRHGEIWLHTYGVDMRIEDAKDGIMPDVVVDGTEGMEKMKILAQEPFPPKAMNYIWHNTSHIGSNIGSNNMVNKPSFTPNPSNHRKRYHLAFNGFRIY